VHEQIVQVDCYSGYEAGERPLRLKLQDGAREIVAIEDRWFTGRDLLSACASAMAIATCFAMKKPRMSGAWPDIVPVVRPVSGYTVNHSVGCNHTICWWHETALLRVPPSSLEVVHKKKLACRGEFSSMDRTTLVNMDRNHDL
jgi:hypothetical protein